MRRTLPVDDVMYRMREEWTYIIVFLSLMRCNFSAILVLEMSSNYCQNGQVTARMDITLSWHMSRLSDHNWWSTILLH